MGVPYFFIAAFVDLLEVVIGVVVHGRHVASLAGESLDVDRVGEVSEVDRVQLGLSQVG